MKNIIVGFFTVLTLGLMAWTASVGGAYNGGEHGKVIADIGNNFKKIKQNTIPQEKSDREKETQKLNALRDKAGNIGAFDVSQEYKSKCSSCHGVNGSGFQNGRKMMGAKLIGLSEEQVYKKLSDFKSGRKENMIMKGLLMKLNDDDLKRFAKEIGEFPARKKAQETQK